MKAKLALIGVMPVVFVLAAAMTAHLSGFGKVHLGQDEERLFAFVASSPQLAMDRRVGSEKASPNNGADLFGLKAAPGVSTGQTAEAPAAPKLNISLIVKNGGRSLAIIDDKLVSAGNTLSGMVVKRIERDKVLLDDKWVSMEK